MRQRRFSVVLGAVAALTVAVVPPASASAGRGGDGPAARVWVTTADGAELMHDRGTVAFAQRRPTGELTITVDPSRDATSAWTASARRSPTPRPSCSTGCDPARPRRRRCATCSTRHGDGLSVPAPADGRLGLRRRARTTPTTTCRAGQTDYALRALLASPTTSRRSCRCCARRWRSTPASRSIGDAVEPAGVDEDQRLAHRRPADRRPARSTGAYARLLREVRAGLPARPACRSTPSRVQNEPQNRNPSGYPGTDMPVAPGGEADRGGSARRCGAAGLQHEDPRLRPQLVRAPRTTSPTRRRARTPRPSTRTELLAAPAGALDRRHRVPLLRRRPGRADRPARRVPGQGHLVHRVLRLARRRATRRPRSSATR